ncbi:MAG TPA: GreA/GreB family elongation factor [Candidatus Paceibacterota bacterium]|nr:GreA/GreB family elongation factor [Candidatus Paceibacterota bacterium]
MMEDDGKRKKITLGDTVRIRLENGEERTYTVVQSDRADPGKGFISDMCPIGQAVIGAMEGEKKIYNVRGEESELVILKITKK